MNMHKRLIPAGIGLFLLLQKDIYSAKIKTGFIQRFMDCHLFAACKCQKFSQLCQTLLIKSCCLFIAIAITCHFLPFLSKALCIFRPHTCPLKYITKIHTIALWPQHSICIRILCVDFITDSVDFLIQRR